MTTAESTCARPGCGGEMDDGYCLSCGLPPEQAAATAGSGSASSTPAGSGSASSTPASSGSGGSTPVGSGSAGSGSAGSAPAVSGAAARPVPDRESTQPSTRGSTAGTLGTSTGARAARRGDSLPGSTSSRSSSRRGRLGAGLVDVPAVPPVDPQSALLVDPQVAEHKRFCRVCDQPVGRGKDGRPGRAEGFCPRDGTRFSFLPTLTPGTLVGDQYQVAGCLAYGGLGWIYLALDRNVNDRWVVLKGLLDTGDDAARKASAAERRFLAEVSHPNIVTIHNFVEHPGADGNPVGYIVMEYVGGVSLRTLVERAGVDGRIGTLPLPQVIAYGLEVLPALGHLHGQGLAYCDLKPDNVIQLERRLKLIDMGAVVPFREADTFDWYGTPGYQAPEFDAQGPTPAADIFTVGRTLAVLALGMIPLRRGTTVDLPDPQDSPLLAQHESFDRLLRRATDPDPLRRFDSAEEMADQLGGVLREVLAAGDGQPRPGPSTVFSPPRAVFAPGLLGDSRAPGRPVPETVGTALPLPLVDTDDPAAGLLATATAAEPAELLRLAGTLSGDVAAGVELRLRVVRAHLEAGDVDAGRAELARLETEHPGDWRIDWFRGCADLVAGAPGDAAARFDTVLAMLPGEAAPKLALAVAAEIAGDDATAGRYYRQVGRPDPGVADAAFGAARVSLRAGRVEEALAALDTVPPTSRQHLAAQTVAVRVGAGDTDLVAAGHGAPGATVDEASLRRAAGRLDHLELDDATAHELRASIFSAALPLVAGVRTETGPPLLGRPWSERGVRSACEAELRGGARLAGDDERRWALVDRANAVRPRSWT